MFSLQRFGQRFGSEERGTALVEFAIGAAVFLSATLGVLEFGRLLWTHNALADATRRGARYAVTHSEADAGKVRNMVVYGSEWPGDGARPMLADLSVDDVAVSYAGATTLPTSTPLGYSVGQGRATVRIDSYQFRFVVPLFGTTIDLPAYSTTLTAESAGVGVPEMTPTPSGSPTPTPVPTATPAPTATPVPTPTPQPTATPSPTPRPTATPVPTPTPRPTPTPCVKPNGRPCK